MSSTTPIDEEQRARPLDLHLPGRPRRGRGRAAADSFCAGVSQDIPIWENKVYRAHPVLTSPRRTILEHRRWARQFYSPYEGPRHQWRTNMTQNRWVREPLEAASSDCPSRPAVARGRLPHRPGRAGAGAAAAADAARRAAGARPHHRHRPRFGDFRYKELVGYFAVDAVYDGQLGEYPLLMPIDLEPAVAISREKFGEPKKLAEIESHREGITSGPDHPPGRDVRGDRRRRGRAAAHARAVPAGSGGSSSCRRSSGRASTPDRSWSGSTRSARPSRWSGSRASWCCATCRAARWSTCPCGRSSRSSGSCAPRPTSRGGRPGRRRRLPALLVRPLRRRALTACRRARRSSCSSARAAGRRSRRGVLGDVRGSPRPGVG